MVELHVVRGVMLAVGLWVAVSYGMVDILAKLAVETIVLVTKPLGVAILWFMTVYAAVMNETIFTTFNRWLWKPVAP